MSAFYYERMHAFFDGYIGGWKEGKKMIPDKQTREDWRKQSHYEPWLCVALDVIDFLEKELTNLRDKEQEIRELWSGIYARDKIIDKFEADNKKLRRNLERMVALADHVIAKGLSWQLVTEVFAQAQCALAATKERNK